jgi:hypothetical protein
VAEKEGDQVKKTLKLSNVWGLPFITEKALATLRRRFNVVAGVEQLFHNKPNKPTIVIDQFTKLRESQVPILGYTQLGNGLWHKHPVEFSKLGTNEVEIRLPRFIGSPTPIRVENGATTDPDLLIEFHACKTEKDYKKLMKKYQAEIDQADRTKDRKFKWLGHVLRDMLNKSKKEEE